MICCILVLPLAAKAAVAPKPLDLTNKSDITDIKKIRNFYFATQKLFLACVKSGKGDADCKCKYKKYYVYLKQLTKQTFENHPEWLRLDELRYIEDDQIKSVMTRQLRRLTSQELLCVRVTF